MPERATTPLDCPRCGRTYNPEPVDDPGVCCVCTRDLREEVAHGPDWRKKVVSEARSAANRHDRRFHGEAKLQALADEVFKNGEIDDLEARSILAYIDELEKQVAGFVEIAEERKLRGINASARLEELQRGR